jgi:hypothetical protein
VKNATDFQSPNDTTIGQPPQSPQRPQPRPGIVAFSLKKEAICQAKGMLKGATPAKADARSENNTKMRRPKENTHTPLSARCCLAVSSMLWLLITRDNDYCPYDECYHTQPRPHPLPRRCLAVSLTTNSPAAPAARRHATLPVNSKKMPFGNKKGC